MDKKIQGMTLDFWQSIYRPGMPEFAGSSWAYTVESDDTIRLAFGNLGPYNEKGERSPVFTTAVTIPAAAAVNLAEALLKHFGTAKASRPATSAEN
jgi:hypothetical protein